jgi:hypothetical protein
VNGLLKEVGSDSAGTPALEDSMTTSKSLVVVSALLVVGASLAVAQNSPATGGQPPEAGDTASNPAAPSSAAAIPARTARHHGTRHHRMYMMSVNRTHKGSKMTPASNAKLQMKR